MPGPQGKDLENWHVRLPRDRYGLVVRYLHSGWFLVRVFEGEDGEESLAFLYRESEILEALTPGLQPAQN